MTLIKEHTKIKVKKRAKTAVKIWRTLASTIIFLILMPTFIANHEGDHFFTIVLLITALACGLIIIIKQPLRKKLQNYLESAMWFLLIGALLLFFAAGAGIMWLQLVLLGFSALFYAFGLQRLGISYLVGIP